MDKNFAEGFESTSPSLYSYSENQEALGKRRSETKNPSAYSDRKAAAHSQLNESGPMSRGTFDSTSNNSTDRHLSDETVPSFASGTDSSCSLNEKSESPVEHSRAPSSRKVLDQEPQPLRSPSSVFTSLQTSKEFTQFNNQPEQDGMPVLPSLGNDALVRAAFSHQSSQKLEHSRHNNSNMYNSWRRSSGPTEPSGPNGPQGPQGPSGSHIEYNAELQEESAEVVEHVATSSSERPYRCTYKDCDWSFLRSSDQKRHVRSHNKPLLQCPFWKADPSCHRNGGAFNRLDVLKRHLRLMHFVAAEGDSGTCKVCNQVFETLKLFIDHCQTCARNVNVVSITANRDTNQAKAEH